MGAVYLATHTRLNIPVAVKILPPDTARDPVFVERFLREAQFAARIRHSNVVSVLDADRDTDSGLYYVVQEYVNGGTVGELLRKGAIGMTRALDITIGVAEALAEAEVHRIIHRDIKPDNIILTDRGQPKLADLGLAKRAGGVRVTMSGASLGTPSYMPPEQIEGASTVDTRADIYSLGATLYAMLTGSPPFTGATAYEVMRKAMTQPVPSLGEKKPDLPESVAAVCMKAMSKDPGHRYQTPRELLEDLRKVRSGIRDASELLAGAAGESNREAEAETGLPDNSPEGTIPVRPARRPVGGRLSRPWRKYIVSMLAAGVGAALLVRFVWYGKTATSTAGDVNLDLGGGVKIELVWIPPGEFMMGSPDDEQGRRDNEGPSHSVTISKGFWMGKYEVTQEQYRRVRGETPSEFKGNRNPVEKVSWNDAKALCEALTAQMGKAVRLPTEAEWEYACRAGSTTAYWFGDDMTQLHRCANYRDKTSDLPGGTQGHSETDLVNADGHKTTAPVGSLRANPWGLHDMHGNVYEWCEDWYGEYSERSVTDPRGPLVGRYRTVRGGAWDTSFPHCRAANRSYNHPGYSNDAIGFRVVVSPRPESRQ